MNHAPAYCAGPLAFVFSTSIIAPAASPALVGHPRDAVDQPAGLWVVIGVQKDELLFELAAHAPGKVLLQGLCLE